jgi:ribosomal protein S27AE
MLYAFKITIMSKKLKDLNEHNAQASGMQWAMNDDSSVLNGIACPKCGEEMYDSNPMVTLTSMPAQKNVHCSKCDYVGYRIA